jgi:hypothetical protein
MLVTSFVLGSTSTMFSSLYTLFFGDTLYMMQVLRSKYVRTLVQFDQLNMCMLTCRRRSYVFLLTKATQGCSWPQWPFRYQWQGGEGAIGQSVDNYVAASDDKGRRHYLVMMDTR